MDGIICPKCKQQVSDVGATIRKPGAVDRYRYCNCGRGVPTIEVPKAQYNNLVRLANSLPTKTA